MLLRACLAPLPAKGDYRSILKNPRIPLDYFALYVPRAFTFMPPIIA
jgi:hypothetical protein